MYKVMLCDDEKLVIEGIKNIIDWDTLNIVVEQTAENGKSAIEKFRDNYVDIIITDINMPVISGLELLEKIKEINQSVKFIIISGYENFNYAKQAIHIGIEGYILKPIDEEELFSILQNIVKELDEKNNRDELDIGKKEILKDLLKGDITKEQIYMNKEMFNISLNHKVYVSSILLIQDGANDIKINDINNTDIFYDEYGNIILISSFKNNEDANNIKQLYENIINEINLNYQKNSFIAIGTEVDSIEDIHKSFKHSNILKKEILLTGYGVCIVKNTINTSKDNYRKYDIKNEVNKLNTLVVEGKVDELHLYLDDILDKNGTSPQDIYSFAIKAIMLYENMKVDLRINDDDDIYMLGQEIIKISNFTNIPDIRQYLMYKLEYLMDNIQYEESKVSPIIRQIIKYTNENYDKPLNLKILGLKYNINTSYLGQVFIKDMGSGYSEYLNKIRNTVAKDLILNTNKKITQISKEVGYVDTSYFYRQFKKYYCVTPIGLRELKNY